MRHRRTRLHRLLYCLTAVAALVMVSAATAQETTVTATIAVVDHLGQPLEGATVQLLDMGRVVVREGRTDEAGRIAWSDLPRGTYELRVSSPIHAGLNRVVELYEDAVHLDLTMRPAGVEERVTVTASRGMISEESKIPATVRALDEVALQTRAVDLLPRMLAEEPGILTQQTTPGQGSPILRGQSAQGVLYLVDGVRYNNATYRAGNTQYLAWIPDSGVEGVEAQLGPAAVAYGSDALGGAINVLTPTVPGYSGEGTRVSGSARVFGESASQGVGGSLTGGVSGARAAGFVTVSGARHQDLRTGGAEDSHHATVRYLGFTQDQVRDIFGNRLVDTGYGQTGVTSKATFRLTEAGSLSAFFTGSEQYDVRRYDRLLGGQGRVRADFTPQRMRFGYLRFQTHSEETFFDATASVNRQVDGRIDQRRPTSPIGREQTGVTVYGFETTASTVLGENLLAAGAEVYHDTVDSWATETADGVTSFLRPPSPNGSSYTSFGAYVSDDLGLWQDRLELTLGLRFSAFRYSARAADNVFGGEALVADASESASDLTFDAGAIYALTDEVGVWTRVARGFRAPSIFDFAELGLTGGGFEVSPVEAVDIGAFVGDSSGPGALSTGTRWSGLQPETLWSYEAGVRWFGDDARFELTGFTSQFRDFISRRVLIVGADVVGGTIGGQTIIDQDEAGRIYVPIDSGPVVSRANIGRIRIWGVESLYQKSFADAWRATIKASLQRGKELDTGFHAEKIAPDNLTLALRWRSRGGNLWVEGVARGALTQDRYNPEDAADDRLGAFRTPDDIEDFFVNQGPRLGLVDGGVLLATGETLEQVIARVLPDGAAPIWTETPGWLSLGLRGSWMFRPGHSLLVALDNITDANYRFHGSGFDALGINLTASYSAEF